MGKKKPQPWVLSFDETNCIWSIDDASGFKIARVLCYFDGRNDERRHAAHLMANAEKMYAYINAMAERGDAEARGMVDDIQVAIMKDFEELKRRRQNVSRES
jgi:hypothetical protein